MDAGDVLSLFLTVALAALHASQFVRVRHLFHVAVAGRTFDSGVRRGLQGRRMDTRGHAGLPLPYTRSGIVACGTILGTRGLRLLSAQTGGQSHQGQSQLEGLRCDHPGGSIARWKDATPDFQEAAASLPGGTCATETFCTYA
jgi:hypothetical protein